MKPFNAQHRRGDMLDEAVVLLENVVELSDLPDPDGVSAIGEFQDYAYGLQVGQIGATLVYDNPVRNAVCSDHLLEKSPGVSLVKARRR